MAKGTDLKSTKMLTMGSITITKLVKRGSGGNLVEADITVGSNEYVDYVEMFDDDNGEPGDWVSDLWWDSTSGSVETWVATAADIDSPHPVENSVYHVVAWVVVTATISASATAT